MSDKVWQLVDAVKAEVSKHVGKAVENGELDDFSMGFDEPSQTWTFEISFNMGDDRTLKIKLDVNPDA